MAVSRVTNLIKVFDGHFVPLLDAILLEAYEWAMENDVEIKDLVQLNVCEGTDRYGWCERVRGIPHSIIAQ